MYVIMKTICPAGYQHNSFTATHALGHMSGSNINEDVRAVLFFKQKYFTRIKSTKTHVIKQKQNASILNALKRHLRRRKSLAGLYTFLCLLCAFCASYAFLCVN